MYISDYFSREQAPKLFFEAAFCFLFYKAFQTKEKHRPDWETVLLLHCMPPYSAPVKTGSALFVIVLCQKVHGLEQLVEVNKRANHDQRT